MGEKKPMSPNGWRMGQKMQGRWQTMVTVVASGVNDGWGVLSLRLRMQQGVAHLILTGLSTYHL